MLIEVTRDFMKYRECMLAIWRDIAKRLEPDWDIRDAFADIGGRIFELYIGDKCGIPNLKKAKEYEADPAAMPNVFVKPTADCREIWHSPTMQQWEKYSGGGTPCWNWVDFYDFDELSPDRSFEYVLAKDGKENILLKTEKTLFFLDR